MAVMRKASSYSRMRVVPFTRISKRKNRSYIKVVPPQKIVKFSMGNTKGKFLHRLRINADHDCQIRDGALESCRQYINKQLDTQLLGQYFFKVVPFPHHIQREHKMLTGAGADRMSSGMQLSFGRSICKAALVKKNSSIFILEVNTERALQIVRKAVNEVRSKIPCSIRTAYEKIV
jgi:large subunit ribosomal protein L10e